MAIGRNFEEAFLKAWASLEQGCPYPRPLTRADESEGEGMAERAHEQLPDSVLVDWKPQLRDAKSLCTVGTVYLNSPAQTAGLRSGDSLVAFGAVQHADFVSVAESIVPLVKASVGKPIDCVVVRLDEASGVHQVALTLTPKSWSGAGLLGCILK